MARFSPQQYCAVRSATELLAAPLTGEDQTVQSMPEVSPTKWHRAHTTWFFEEFVLARHLPGHEVHHPGYGYLFNSYYESVGPRHERHRRGLLTRPDIEEVAAYRRAVDEAMLDLLADGPPAEVLGLVELGLHHEQQHQELLLMDIKHVLAQNPLDPCYQPGWEVPVPSDAGPGWVEHPGGRCEIGHDGSGFAFDNESPRHEVLLRPFAVTSRPVTCGEWMAFMDDGAYQRPELWLSDGWATVASEGWEAPLYWQRDGREAWTTFTLSGRRAPAAEEPVCHVSYYEADAYARWAGVRLPSEAEWEVVVPGCSHGEVWEWTASPYGPYPGFRPAPGAVGEYNGKFMVNQQVLRGGCRATPAGHGRPTYRNFFPPGARWAFCGLRLARDLP